jgi:signal peptidase I
LKKYIYITILLLLPLFAVNAQVNSPEKFLQLSGIITDGSFSPVPGVAVISKKLHRGTVSERSGIYSITTTPGDTIFFRALGFKRYHTIIPESYESRHCLVDIVLETDTIPIAEVKIMPWKNYSEFLKDMTKEKPVDPLIVNMNENIASIYVAVNNQTGYRITPEAGYRYAMNQNFNATSSRYINPVYSLLNPFAWAKFIDDVKRGLLKNKSFKKPEPAKVIKKKKKSGKK